MRAPMVRFAGSVQCANDVGGAIIELGSTKYLMGLSKPKLELQVVLMGGCG